MTSAVDYVMKNMPDGEQVSLDMTDHAVLDFVQESYDRVGLGPEHRPGLHKKIKEQHEMREDVPAPAAPTATETALADDGWKTGAQVAGIGKLASGSDAAASGFVSFIGGVSTCTPVIQVLAPKEGYNILAAGSNSDYGNVGHYQPHPIAASEGERTAPE